MSWVITMDWHSVQVPAALIAGAFAIMTAVYSAWKGSQTATELARVKGELDAKLIEQRDRLDNKIQYAAEDVAFALMRDSKWRLRSFLVIKIHLGGFEDDELRKILVRAGAIRFEAKSGSELWELFERNRDLLGVTKVPWDPQNPRQLPNWASPPS